MFSPVLSSIIHILLRAQTISSPFRLRKFGRRHVMAVEKRAIRPVIKTGTSRYGVKPNNVLNSSLDLFVRVA